MQLQLNKNKPRNNKWHLIWCVALLLIVTAVALSRFDGHPPSTSEFKSMFNAGEVVGGPYSPVDIFMSLVNYSDQHTPGFFMILAGWGNLISWEVPILRYMSVLVALLSLAMMYRIGFDFVSPLGGIVAITVLATTAFYSFYIPHVRMYAFFTLFGLITLWLYLRILYMRGIPTKWDYRALFLAVFGFLNMQIYSVTVLFVMGVYHLLFVKKDRRWFRVSIAVTSGVVVFSPYFYVIIAGIPLAVETKISDDMSFYAFVDLWLNLSHNGSWVLVLITSAGVMLSIWKSRIVRHILILGMLYFVFMGIFSEVAPVINTQTGRYMFGGWGLMVLWITTGIIALYRVNRLFIVLVPIWILQAVMWSPQPSWKQFIAEEATAYRRAPDNVVSRLAMREPEPPKIISLADLSRGYQLETFNNMNYSQFYYYFRDRGLDLEQAPMVDRIEQLKGVYADNEPVIWVYYLDSQVNDGDRQWLFDVMPPQYELCNTLELGDDTLLHQYHWTALECGRPITTATYTNDALDYEFDRTFIDTTEKRLLFVDRWTTRAEELPDSLLFSYQLLTPDWDNVSQLDIPLVNDGRYKTYALDIDGLPAGTYRLVGILYDSVTGDKYDWSTDGTDLGNLLTLTEVVIP